MESELGASTSTMSVLQPRTAQAIHVDWVLLSSCSCLHLGIATHLARAAVHSMDDITSCGIMSQCDMPTMALTMTSMHYSLVLQLEHMPITFAHSRVQVMQQATAVIVDAQTHMPHATCHMLHGWLYRVVGSFGAKE